MKTNIEETRKDITDLKKSLWEFEFLTDNLKICQVAQLLPLHQRITVYTPEDASFVINAIELYFDLTYTEDNTFTSENNRFYTWLSTESINCIWLRVDANDSTDYFAIVEWLRRKEPRF